MTEPPRNAMTKADLINIVAKRLDITQVQSGIIVEAALRSVVTALQNGQEVEIRGFGSFRFRNRAPRKGRNPKTGEKVDVPPKKIPYFKMGKELKALLERQRAGRGRRRPPKARPRPEAERPAAPSPPEPDPADDPRCCGPSSSSCFSPPISSSPACSGTHRPACRVAPRCSTRSAGSAPGWPSPWRARGRLRGPRALALDTRNVVVMPNHVSHLDALVLFGLDRPSTSRRSRRASSTAFPSSRYCLHYAGFIEVDRKGRPTSRLAIAPGGRFAPRRELLHHLSRGHAQPHGRARGVQEGRLRGGDRGGQPDRARGDLGRRATSCRRGRFASGRGRSRSGSWTRWTRQRTVTRIASGSSPRSGAGSRRRSPERKAWFGGVA